MPIKPHTCVIAECDICGYVYDHEAMGEEHFDNADALRKALADDGEWTVTDDNRVICPADDCRNATA